MQTMISESHITYSQHHLLLSSHFPLSISFVLLGLFPIMQMVAGILVINFDIFKIFLHQQSKTISFFLAHVKITPPKKKWAVALGAKFLVLSPDLIYNRQMEPDNSQWYSEKSFKQGQPGRAARSTFLLPAPCSCQSPKHSHPARPPPPAVLRGDQWYCPRGHILLAPVGKASLDRQESLPKSLF